ncbi:hypothetical protein [Gorillibacterium sp. sgz5001074]|uniref:hypothetical protein n=1 Tax=Gorillibacterium sp. sgz5001074 TaxID=3446695 RepID=UPI003F676D0F
MVHRKVMLPALIVLLILGGDLLTVPSRALACSCATPPAVQEDLEKKTAVFSGQVIRVEQPPAKPVLSSADPLHVTLKVTRVWKGDVKAETAVYTARSSASCGYDQFAVHKEYIVFAAGSPDHLETGLCTRTKLLSAAGEELAILGPGSQPAPGTAGIAPGAAEKLEAEARGQKGASTKALWSLGIMVAGISVFAYVRRKKAGRG